LGFNFGKMNPKAALSMLKKKVGVVSEHKSNKIMLHDWYYIVIVVIWYD
jgi:hypothetical protein